jgi:hypothetical protein
MVTYRSTSTVNSSGIGALSLVHTERSFVGWAREDVGPLLAKKPRPNVEEGLLVGMLCAKIAPFVTR